MQELGDAPRCVLSDYARKVIRADVFNAEVAAPLARLEVRGAYGEPVRLRELDAGDGLRLFLADFDGSTQGFGYTAYDAAGNVLDSAIT